MKQKSRGKSKRQSAAKAQIAAPVRESNTTVVAIGASAGGIEALTDLMTYLSPDTGMAFVVVQHLDSKHHSILTELLARKTTMSVTEVSDGVPVKPNHVYLVPDNRTRCSSNPTSH